MLRVRGLIAVMVVALSALAHDAVGIGDVEDPWDNLDMLPEACDAGLVLDSPGVRLFGDGASEAAHEAIHSTGFFSQTERAWAGLSEALGLKPGEAVEALLSRRVLIGWSGLMPQGPEDLIAALLAADRSWVVAVEVDAAIGERIGRALKAVPRRVHRGRVVYSADSGRLQMSLLEMGEREVLAVSPIDARELIDGLIDGLVGERGRQDGPLLGASARATFGDAPQEWAAVGAGRVADGCDDDSSGTAAFALRVEDGAWRVETASACSMEAPEMSAPVEVMRSLGGDALFAVASARSPVLTEDKIDLGAGLLFGLGGDDGAIGGERSIVLARGMVAVVRREPGDKDYRVLIVSHGAASSGDSMAVAFDRLMGRVIGGEEFTRGYDGSFPRAVRHDWLEDNSGGADADEGLGHARVAWCFEPDDGVRSGVISVAIGPGDEIAVGSARRGREAWVRHAGRVDHAGLLSEGFARPAALLEAVDDPMAQALRSVMRGLERVEWSVRADDGRLRADVRVRFTEQAVRLGVPDGR